MWIVPITGLTVQTQALEFAKKLNIANFQESDGCLRNWKEKQAGYSSRSLSIKKVKLESFLDNAMNSSSVEFNRKLQ